MTGMMLATGPIYDPVQLTHLRLRGFAIIAAWISTVAESAHDLEDLLIDVPPEERMLPDYSTPWPWEFDSLVVAISLVQDFREEAEQSLEDLLATWLSEDRENWSVLCLTVIGQWKERPGIWSEETPEWVRIFGRIATTAHEKYDPFGRRPTS
jgi:hypothetical protein